MSKFMNSIDTNSFHFLYWQFADTESLNYYLDGGRLSGSGDIPQT